MYNSGHGNVMCTWLKRNIETAAASREQMLHYGEIGSHRFNLTNNFFQPSFALWFQDIKIPPFRRRSVGKQSFMTRDTLWGEGATRNVVLVDTETCAEYTQSIERRDGNGNASQVEVKESFAHLVIGLYAHGGCIGGNIGLKLDKEDRIAGAGAIDFAKRPTLPCNKEYHTGVHRTFNAFELRSNLVVFRSREEVGKEGIERPIIIVFLGSELVNGFKL